MTKDKFEQNTALFKDDMVSYKNAIESYTRFWMKSAAYVLTSIVNQLDTLSVLLHQW